MHLFERDCSVQRRHRKVVGSHPRPTSTPSCATGCRRRGALRQRDRLPQRRRSRVPARPGRRLRAHRDGPARIQVGLRSPRRSPMWTWCSRRCGSRRRDPRRPRPLAGEAERSGARLSMPDHHRGPGEQLRPDTGRVATYAPGGARHPPRWRNDVHRREVSAHFDSMWPGPPAAAAPSTWPSATPAAHWLSSGCGASRPTWPPPAVLDGADSPLAPTDHELHRDPSAAARRPREGDRGTELLTYLADVTVTSTTARRRPARPGAEAARLDLSGASDPTGHGRRCSSAARSRRRAGAAAGARSPTPPSATPTEPLATRVRTHDLLAVTGHVRG